MANTSTCYSLVRGKVLRVTKLDACGVPVLGPDSTVVSKGFITVSLSAITEAGNTISVSNANGDVCIKDEPIALFEGFTVEIALCGVNPDLFRLLSCAPMVTDSAATPVNVGFRMNSDVNLDNCGFALEMWSDVPGQACAPGLKSYGYFLLPYVKGGTMGDFTVGNDAVNFTIKEAKTKTGSGWGVGPYNITRNVSGVATPLKTAIVSGDHLDVELVTVAPPVDLCGSAALGVPATTITAGIPATFVPANSYAPLNLAGLTGVLASPTTNWTSGQYVLLRDGTYANWNGTTWVAGIHA